MIGEVLVLVIGLHLIKLDKTCMSMINVAFEYVDPYQFSPLSDHAYKISHVSFVYLMGRLVQWWKNNEQGL